MARKRFFRPQENVRRGPRINDRIRVREVRLVDENEQMVGVVETREALRMAQDADLDLVEISPNSDPPVCRIMDYGKYKYEQSKKEKANKARSKGGELKEVRMGRSMKIDPHDVQIRLNQARRFLIEGNKVQIVQNFRGREMHHRDRGNDRMKGIIDALADLGKVEVPPRFAGRRMTMIIAPDKAKVDRFVRELKRKGGTLPSGDDAPPPPIDDDHDDDFDDEIEDELDHADAAPVSAETTES
ncbi:MAG: translation initiation factor IF-3 [Phycisphaerales bacterium]|nr:translation initiation factor IF-3 [Phycisphaerales bacterium]